MTEKAVNEKYDDVVKILQVLEGTEMWKARALLAVAIDVIERIEEQTKYNPLCISNVKEQVIRSKKNELGS